MSKELEKLENRAKMKSTKDHEHIDRIINNILCLPFSFFQLDEVRYNFLRDDFYNGFNLCKDDIQNLSFEDVLILIGYEPGNPFFDPPDTERISKRMGRKFNAAGHSYVLSLAINNLSKKNIHIKEFTRIEISAFTDYLREKVEDEYRNSLIPFSTCADIQQKIVAFKHKASEYMSDGSQAGGNELQNGVTVGDLISKAINICGRSWFCSVKSLEKYCSEILESYDLLARMFMDSVRMPLIRQDRERFQEIMVKYRDRSRKTVNIDFESCYEHGGITKQ